MMSAAALADLFDQDLEAQGIVDKDDDKNWMPDSPSLCDTESQSPETLPHENTCSRPLPASSRSLSSLSSCSSPGPVVRKCLNYNELPISVKVRLIRDYETENCSQRSLARKYTVSRGTVNQIIKQKTRYLSEFAKIQSMAGGSGNGMRGNCLTLKRVRKTSVSNLNHVLEQFVAESRLNKWTLTGPKLKQKAREVAQGMGLSDFKASNGWLDHFKKRCSLEFNSGKSSAASGRRSNQENRNDISDHNLPDLNNNNSDFDDIKVCGALLPDDDMNDQRQQVCDCRMEVSPFNLMDLNDDTGNKVPRHPTSSSITSSSPHSASELNNFTADSSVPTLDLHFSTDGISVPAPETRRRLQVDDFRVEHQVLVSNNNTGPNDNCHNQSEWMIHGFDETDDNDTSAATAPSPDTDGLPHADHSLTHHHLHPHPPHHHHPHQHQQQLAVQLHASRQPQQHSHPEQQAMAEDQQQLPENLHLNSLPHTLSLPSDQMIQLQLSGHMADGDSALTADSVHHKLTQSSSPQTVSTQHSTSGAIGRDMKQQQQQHCRLLLTVNTSNSGNCDNTAARSSPSSVKCHHPEISSQIEVPAIADVRSAIDTLERFALTKMPPLLSSILCIRQEVGNFVIQQTQQIQHQQQPDQCNHHQHQLQQPQQHSQQQQNHLLIQ